MNAVEEQVKKLVEKELESANKKFPQFFDEHHGFSVLHKEIDEVNEESEILNNEIGEIWSKIKSNTLNRTVVQIAYNSAVHLACEAIQVAAMCSKLIVCIDNKGKGGKGK